MGLPFIVVRALASFVFVWQTNALSVQRSHEENTSHEDFPGMTRALTSLTSANHSRSCPSMFVAIVTSLDNSERRNEIRAMWRAAGEKYDGFIEYRYVLCTRGPKGWSEGGITDALRREQDEHGDLVFMDCEEGYLNGILTRKVAESMRYYLQNFKYLDLYMKIDDDTFISTDKLCDLMEMKKRNGVDFHQVYAGVFWEGNEHMTQKHPVIRDEESPWYEPYEKYAAKNYPISAKGGPGYILPMQVVKTIITEGIDKKFELNNEDKAVGYWVTKVDVNKELKYVNINGTDGYEEHEQWIKKKGPWSKYPHVLHHHLDGKTISCLHEVEFSGDAETLIGPCFTQSLFARREVEHVRIHMPY